MPSDPPLQKETAVDNEFDYIITGGGAAGCVLAARLTQDPAVRVLLLEAGPPGVPASGGAVPPAGTPACAAAWDGETVPGNGAGAVPYPRGRVLGGSAAIGAALHVRPHQGVLDGWAAGSAPGWDAASMLPYFKRSEDARSARDHAVRGSRGGVRVEPVPEPARHPVARAFAESLMSAGYPVTSDLSWWRQEGVAWPDLAVAGGRRVTPAGAYLPASARARANLTVRTGCLATRLLIMSGACAGVTWLHGRKTERAFARGEVIVCAGAIGTPHLLMLSGIGPAAHLREHGIPVAADLPGVGGNLRDHAVAHIACRCAAPVHPSRYGPVEACAVLRSTLVPGGIPDLLLYPVLRPGALPGLPHQPGPAVLAAALTTPAASGLVRLASASPADPPLIDPGLLNDDRDLERLETGLAILCQAVGAAPLTRLGITPVPPPRTAAARREWLRRTVAAACGPAGTLQDRAARRPARGHRAGPARPRDQGPADRCCPACPTCLPPRPSWPSPRRPPTSSAP